MTNNQFIALYLSFIIASFTPLSIKAQNDAPFCKSMLDSAKMELKNRNFNVAREYCEAALPLCIDNSVAIHNLMKDINNAIDAEKRAAENAAKFMQVKEYDQTLAMRMMEYNSKHHPESQISHDMYKKTISESQNGFYKKILRGHLEPILAVAFSPDGKKILTGSCDKTAKLWDVETGKVEKIYAGHSSEVTAVAFSPDGAKILTGSNDHTAKLWDLVTQKVEKTFIGHAAEVTSVAFSTESESDSLKILTGSKDNTAKTWDVASGETEKTFIGHLAAVNAVAYSLDGSKILTGSSDNTVKLWNISNGNIEKNFMGHAASVYALAFSPDRKQILTGSSDNTAKLWNISTGKSEKSFIGHSASIYTVAFSFDGSKVLTGSFDKTAKLWNVWNGNIEKNLIGHSSEVTAVAFSPDSKQALTGGWDNTSKLWNIENDSIENDVPLFTFYEMVQAGLQIETNDTPQYQIDRTAFLNKTTLDSIEYQQLMNETKKSEVYKKHLQAIEEWKISPKRSEDISKIEIFMNEEKSKQKKEDSIKVEDLRKDAIIQKLDNEILSESDTLKKHSLYTKLIETLKVYHNNSPTKYAERLATAYNNRGWYNIILKKFENGEEDIRTGIGTNPQNPFLYTNLPHTLLLQGKFKAAKKEYLSWKDKEFNKQGFDTYKDVFLFDLTDFEKANIIPKERMKDVAAIKRLLERRVDNLTKE